MECHDHRCQAADTSSQLTHHDLPLLLSILRIHSRLKGNCRLALRHSFNGAPIAEINNRTPGLNLSGESWLIAAYEAVRWKDISRRCQAAATKAPKRQNAKMEGIL